MGAVNGVSLKKVIDGSNNKKTMITGEENRRYDGNDYTIQQDGMKAWGNYKTDELNEHLNVIKTHNSILHSQIKDLEGFEWNKAFDSFQDGVKEIMDKYNNMDDRIYSREGIKEQMQIEIKKLADTKIQEAKDMTNQYKEEANGIIDSINRKVNAHNEELTQVEVDRINLRNNELDGNIRGELYVLGNPKEVEQKFDELVRQAKHDDGLKRFLTNHYYMFMDRAEKTAKTDMESFKAHQNIKRQADELKQSQYSDEQISLFYVRDHLSKESYATNNSQRLISSHLDKHIEALKAK